jgi:hypothetical protein
MHSQQYLQEIEQDVVECLHLAQDMYTLRAVVKMVMNARVPKMLTLF